MNAISRVSASIAMSVMALMFGACERIPSKWSEEVKLANGETGIIHQNRTFLPRSRNTEAGTLSGEINGQEIVPWSGIYEPLLLERDPASGELVLVGTSDNRLVPLGVPPYRAFRLLSGGWQEVSVPDFVWGMKSNLLVSIQMLERNNQAVSLEQKAAWHATDGRGHRYDGVFRDASLAN